MTNTSKNNTGKIAVGAAVTGLAVGTALGVFAKSDKAKKMKADAEAKLAETKEKAGEMLSETKKKAESKGEEIKAKTEQIKRDIKKDLDKKAN